MSFRRHCGYVNPSYQVVRPLLGRTKKSLRKRFLGKSRTPSGVVGRRKFPDESRTFFKEVSGAANAAGHYTYVAIPRVSLEGMH
jgi:hypothetical protein